jgi:hypothetical protein
MPKGGLSDWAAWRNKSLQSPRVRFLSYRNHLLLLSKHERWQPGTASFWLMVWYEFKKSIAVACTEPIIFFRAWRDIIHQNRQQH